MNARCAAYLLAAASLAAPRTNANAAPTNAAPTAQAADGLAAQVEAYLLGLDAFRSGDDAAEVELIAAAEALARDHGRTDAPDIVGYYASLDREERAAGLALERRFDGLRDALYEADAEGASGGHAAFVRELELLLAVASRAEDVTPAARTAALTARLQVRRLERFEVPVEDEALVAERARLRAEDAVRRFDRAAQRTPQLEPTWVLARIALVEGDTFEAERRFEELEQLATDVGRPAWRERAILGLIGVARDRGASFAARRAIERLATFRSPASCWALAREAAVQRLSEDEPERALDLLEACPPTEQDAEIELEEATEEWRALVLAAQLRSGRLDEAEATLAASIARAGSASGGTARNEATVLAEITLLLDRGEAQSALALLDDLGPSESASDLGRVEALVLRGRALTELGRPDEAIAPLEAAFEMARRRDRDHRKRSASALRDGSAVGEWLGLSTVEVLARAHALRGDALRAAATIEAAHADCAIEVARARLLDLAGRHSLGAVTWVIGADRSLVVHVHADGTAESSELMLGRKELSRAVERVRVALLQTRAAPRVDSSKALRVEVARAILPPSLVTGLARELGTDASPGAPGLALLPHGVLERLPLEALVVTEDDRVLGLAVALSVLDRLRDERSLAAPLDVRRASWTALGAPTNTGLADLPEARRELRSLARLHPRMSVTAGDAFTAESLRRALRGDVPVHVATHVTRTSSRSTIAPLGLVASNGERVTADDIARCAPRLPLLVLAACGTGDGEALDGLGARGLAQAALDGGTRATVVTMWPITDDAGRTASVTFHAALLAGARPAEALRRARIALVRVGAPPSEWAAYRLLGTP